uniref:Uncharacterized protein n=1 Tax=Anguilla anguilla TaxID=7936 RepID=A0A0E9QGE7_ANGAN
MKKRIACRKREGHCIHLTAKLAAS